MQKATHTHREQLAANAADLFPLLRGILAELGSVSDADEQQGKMMGSIYIGALGWNEVNITMLVEHLDSGHSFAVLRASALEGLIDQRTSERAIELTLGLARERVVVSASLPQPAASSNTSAPDRAAERLSLDPVHGDDVEKSGPEGVWVALGGLCMFGFLGWMLYGFSGIGSSSSDELTADELRARVQIGMTKKNVVDVMGSPLSESDGELSYSVRGLNNSFRSCSIYFMRTREASRPEMVTEISC